MKKGHDDTKVEPMSEKTYVKVRGAYQNNDGGNDHNSQSRVLFIRIFNRLLTSPTFLPQKTLFHLAEGANRLLLSCK